MKNHKIGDKFVIEIDKVFEQDGEKLYRAKGMKSLVFDEYGLNILEPLSAYTDPLETKTRRQASHITYLEGKIKELKSDLKHGRTTEDDRDPEAERAAGQREAWELARKISLLEEDGGYSSNELNEIFGINYLSEIFSLTHTEAAAKVAKWKKAKEEICVGDMVECEGSYGVVVGVGEVYVKGFTSDWTPFQWIKKDCTKTGRHIDVDAWLAQIGGDCNE